MREDVRDNLLLALKSVVFVIGGVLAVAGTVEWAVGGFSLAALATVVVGLGMAGGPLALAFADALRHTRD